MFFEKGELIHSYKLSLIAPKIAEILRSEGGDRVKVTEHSDVSVLFYWS